MNRREMISSMGIGAAGLMAGCTAAQARTQPAHAAAAATFAAADGLVLPGYDHEKGEYTLPPLPYAYNALEPHIDEQTMRLHHSRHHQGYVNGLNNALKQLADARASGDFALVQHWSRQVSFHGGGHMLHTIFWQNMAQPANGGGGEPQGELAAMINRDFGSFDAMKAHFSAASAAVEGSGWGIMGYEPVGRKLLIFQGENQQKLTVWGIIPVLVLDVWEHAYYLRYQNNRGQYVQNWWNLVNWSDVARRVSWH